MIRSASYVHGPPSYAMRTYTFLSGLARHARVSGCCWVAGETDKVENLVTKGVEGSVKKLWK